MRVLLRRAARWWVCRCFRTTWLLRVFTRARRVFIGERRVVVFVRRVVVFVRRVVTSMRRRVVMSVMRRVVTSVMRRVFTRARRAFTRTGNILLTTPQTLPSCQKTRAIPLQTLPLPSPPRHRPSLNPPRPTTPDHRFPGKRFHMSPASQSRRPIRGRPPRRTVCKARRRTSLLSTCLPST